MTKLEQYCKKRNFKKTAEPDGSELAAVVQDELPAFVIQEHHATTLHYDLRLEVDGVLKSWAVPKGISSDPRDKRLAVPTEDHPLAYKDFAGVIPEGEYGAGEVIIWDRGHYRNLREGVAMAEAYQSGKVEVELYGKRVHGKYALVRMRYDRVASGAGVTTKKGHGRVKPAPWLLIKMKEV
jgi:DNA ligase D-like protein (predicted 3'-phosphoesterase)